MPETPKSLKDLRRRQLQLKQEIDALELVISEQLEETPEVLIPEILRDAPSSVGGVAKAGLSALTGHAFNGQDNGANETSALQRLLTSPLGRMLVVALVTAVRHKVADGLQNLIAGNGHDKAEPATTRS